MLINVFNVTLTLAIVIFPLGYEFIHIVFVCVVCLSSVRSPVIAGGREANEPRWIALVLRPLCRHERADAILSFITLLFAVDQTT